MMKFLDENEIIGDCQHGFVKKKSFFTCPFKIGLLQLTRATWLTLPVLTSVRNLTQCHIRDSYSSWLGLSILCLKFYLIFFEFPKIFAHYSFVLGPLFQNYCQEDTLLLEIQVLE